MKLIACEKPNDAIKSPEDRSIIRAHIFQGYYVGDKYYEHDETADLWYRLQYRGVK